MEKLRKLVERELDIEEPGSFLDEEPDEKESEEEETTDEKEMTDDTLQISLDDPLEEKSEANNEDEHQGTKNTEEQFIG